MQKKEQEQIKKIDWIKMAKRTLFTIVLLSCFVSGCSWVNNKIGKNDDWYGEELVEDMIEHETGIKIDLSPGSPEN